MSNEEISEGINRLAEIAKNNPAKLEEALAVKKTSLDDLNQLSRVIVDVRKLTVTPEIKDAFQKRFDVLTQGQAIDKNLNNLQSHLYLVRLLDIKAGPAVQKDESLLETGIASRLRGFAEMTKDIPGVNFVTGFFKDISGRGLQRTLYEFLAFFEKTPAAVVGAVGGLAFGPLGSLASAVNFGGFASRKVAEFDIQDVISAEQRVGETITFSGLDKNSMTAFNALVQKKIAENQTAPTIKELAISCIALHRKERPGAPLALTMTEMLKAPDTLKTSRETDAKENRMKSIAEKWASSNVETVKFGSPVGASKLASGKWEVTLSEKDDIGPDGTPISAAARMLLSALPMLVDAKTVTIVTSEEPLTISPKSKKIDLPVGTTVLDNFNRAFQFEHERLNKIVFDSMLLRQDKLVARYDSGTLLLSKNKDRIQGLTQLRTLIDRLENFATGTEFLFDGGEWKFPDPRSLTA